MFSYRGLFLAIIVSLTSIVLADVLVQPGYEHQFGNNLHYSQPVPQYQINSLTKQYRTEQLPNQESRNFPGIQSVRTVYPYHEIKDHSNLISAPYRPYHHYSPNHLRFAKIGSHGYTRPSVFVGYSPMAVHDYNHHKRWRRSLDSDPKNTESNESTIVTHDNDVAPKSPLTDAKHPKTIDSLLPEHEPTDTNDKRVENRQIKYDTVTPPLWHSIDMYPEKREAQNIPFSQAIYPSENIAFFPSASKFEDDVIHSFIEPNTRRPMRTNLHHYQQIGKAYDEVDTRVLSNRPNHEAYNFERSSEESLNDNKYNSDFNLFTDNTYTSLVQPSEASLNDDYSSKYRDKSYTIEIDYLINKPYPLDPTKSYTIDIDPTKSHKTDMEYSISKYLQDFFKRYWSAYYNVYVPSHYYPSTQSIIRVPLRRPPEAILQKSMNADNTMINTAESRQDKMKSYIPYLEKSLGANVPMTIINPEKNPWTPQEVAEWKVARAAEQQQPNIPVSEVSLGIFDQNTDSNRDDSNYFSDEDDSEFKRNSNSAQSYRIFNFES